MKLAAEMLLTLPGNPFIYYGEEIGMFGIKSYGPYWDETRRLPILFGDEYQTSWFEDTFNTELSDIPTQLENSNSLLNTYRNILAVRNDSLALMYGDIFPYEETSRALQGYYRVFNYDEDHQEIVLVLHNLGDADYLLYLEDEDVIYFSDGIENYTDSVNAQSTLILRISNDMMENFYGEE